MVSMAVTSVADVIATALLGFTFHITRAHLCSLNFTDSYQYNYYFTSYCMLCERLALNCITILEHIHAFPFQCQVFKLIEKFFSSLSLCLSVYLRLSNALAFAISLLPIRIEFYV